MNITYKSNIFTKIINHEIKSNIIIETKYSIAIKDINPRAKIHILILPKNAYVNYYNFINKGSIEEQIDFNNIYKQIIELYNIQNDHNIQINNGSTHGQEIFHTHMHILSNKS